MSEYISVKDKFPGFGQVCKVKASYLERSFEGVAVARICHEYRYLTWESEDGEFFNGIVRAWKPHKTTTN